MEAIDEELNDADRHVDFKWLSQRLGCSSSSAKKYLIIRVNNNP
jgi:hypothetical protein